MDLPKSKSYYDLTVLTYNFLKVVFPQAKTKRVIQFCARYLCFIDGAEPSAGTYIEWTRSLFCNDNDSPSYLSQGFDMSYLASPLLDGVPVFACAIVAPKQNYSAENFVSIVNLFSSDRNRAIVSLMLSRIKRGTIKSAKRVKRADYNPEQSTVLGYTIPAWADAFVRYFYFSNEGEDKISLLFPEEKDIQKTASITKDFYEECKKIKKEHNVDVLSVVRYINYWTPIKSNQLYILGRGKYVKKATARNTK